MAQAVCRVARGTGTLFIALIGSEAVLLLYKRFPHGAVLKRASMFERNPNVSNSMFVVPKTIIIVI
jgi:hypothetical protein